MVKVLEGLSKGGKCFGYMILAHLANYAFGICFVDYSAELHNCSLKEMWKYSAVSSSSKTQSYSSLSVSL